ncbi:hypothetical protein AB4K20DRAFT_1794632 [Rhizopus microsporus]|uniref:Cas12f1-like TNB domain-containing protein n=1 Tax=Rhizopus microsporus TaxID=58291 RepID=A0A1X0RK36_RHIZD|nr:hypothetical protein BCV71DRAFT_240222 [Rhizopus microsporus]
MNTLNTTFSMFGVFPFQVVYYFTKATLNYGIQQQKRSDCKKNEKKKGKNKQQQYRKQVQSSNCCLWEWYVQKGHSENERLTLRCCLKKGEDAGDLLVVPIDEFKTSRNCCWCETDAFGSVNDVKNNSVFIYKTCNTLWQRDVNAAKNMACVVQKLIPEVRLIFNSQIVVLITVFLANGILDYYSLTSLNFLLRLIQKSTKRGFQ